MPTGIIINSLSIVIGGILGTIVGEKLSEDFKEKPNMIFGVCAMGMGVSSIVLMENMPAVIFSVVAGTIIGLVIHLGDMICKAAGMMQKQIDRFIKKKTETYHRKILQIP